MSLPCIKRSCQEPTIVLDVRTIEFGGSFARCRRRKCTKCGRRFNTIEVPKEMLEKHMVENLTTEMPGLEEGREKHDKF